MSVVEILTIGNEILDGRVTDTNRTFIGRRVKELGFEVRYAQSVDDHIERIVEALKLAASRSDIVLATGGLGPTSDDMTSEAFAKFAGVAWELNPDAERFVRQVIESRGRAMNPSQQKQAYLPKGATILHNPAGSAPGFSFVLKKKTEFYFFPGVPRELYSMFEESFAKNHKAQNYKTFTWSILFTAESELQELVKAAEAKVSPFKLGFRTEFPENHVSLMGAPTNDKEKKHWEACRKELHTILGPLAYSFGEKTLNLEATILEKLRQSHARLLTVESCTGGLVGHLLTEIPGSSDVFWGSHVTYSNNEKIRLGVAPDTITNFGAVSDECAREMASAGLAGLSADKDSAEHDLYSLATTGIAGPGGATEIKPVGIMYMALAKREAKTKNITIKALRIFTPQHFSRSLTKLYMAKQALHFLL